MTNTPQTITTELPKNIITTIITDKASSISAINIKTNDIINIWNDATTVINEIEATNFQKVEENINVNDCTNEKLINNKCSNNKININQVSQIKQNLLNNYTKENTIIRTENIIS